MNSSKYYPEDRRFHLPNRALRLPLFLLFLGEVNLKAARAFALCCSEGIAVLGFWMFPVLLCLPDGSAKPWIATSSEFFGSSFKGRSQFKVSVSIYSPVKTKVQYINLKFNNTALFRMIRGTKTEAAGPRTCSIQIYARNSIRSFFSSSNISLRVG